jgi:hypothetical protein
MRATRRAIAAAACLLAACGSHPADPGPAAPAAAETQGAGDLQQEAAFGDYTPLSGNTELVRRMMSPLTAAQLGRMVAGSGKALREQEIGLAAERFVLYVPAQAPPQGYALLVFVPPWREAKLPQGWAPVLDQYGMIFVSASRSGNDANTMGRRAPLALLAAHNVMRRYPVDPQRVYVGGLSGGSRVAQRLALAYPDLFRGALLNAGSDPIGEAGQPLPPRDLFQRFQEASRLVYLTGEQDYANLATDADSAESMRRWCVFDLEAQVIHRVGTQAAGHESADPAALSQALQALLHPVPPAPDRLAACRSGLDRELGGQLREVEALTAAGKTAAAKKRLLQIDTRYGGLAAPRSVELAQQLGAFS